MPRYTQNIENVIITESNLGVFNKKLNSETERLIKKGLGVTTNKYLNSCGFYGATLIGYRVIKEL